MFLVSRVLVLREGTAVIRNRFTISLSTFWHCCLYYQRVVGDSNIVLYLYILHNFACCFVWV